MERRAFIAMLGGAAAWPRAVCAQQGAMPVVGFVYPGTPELSTGVIAAFRKGLGEAGFVEGRNVAVELRFAYGDNGRLPELMTDLVLHGQFAVIVAPGSTQAALAAKAATTSIPVVFSVGTDPVDIGLVASLSHPGGNVTGITSLNSELAAKRLDLMLALRPNAMRFALLVNPSNRNAEALIRDAQGAASTIGRQIEILSASTPREIDAVFGIATQKRFDGLLVSPEPLLDNRRVQLVTLAAHQRLPAIYAFRENVEIGGLMSYGSNASERDRQVGLYAGRILKGEAAAGGEIRIRVQSTNRTGARSRGPRHTARTGRRGDRVSLAFAHSCCCTCSGVLAPLQLNRLANRRAAFSCFFVIKCIVVALVGQRNSTHRHRARLFGFEDTADHGVISQLPFFVLLDVDVGKYTSMIIVIYYFEIVRTGRKIRNCEPLGSRDFPGLQLVLTPVV
jgi:ABC-type uncharacterized transport system substrate-binding protein